MDSGSSACRCDGPRWARPRWVLIETQGVARRLGPPHFALGWFVAAPSERRANNGTSPSTFASD